ncbi:MAG: hypothetical protein TEF_09440 [Rhizobiales bacterium NRL2]|jgi:suppressor for copper-sensitivity B|nr:MAG: hypothetical protein TEF_09440 [Rhizobiales bacterium NRL2]
MRPTAFALVLFIATVAGNGTAHAQQDPVSAWAGIPEAEVRLIAGHVPGEGDMLGLHFVLADEWKTYWRSPGDAGLPPVPDWTASSGLGRADLAWPLPERFDLYGLTTYGYHGEAVLPVRIERAPGETTRIRLTLSYAACAEVCVPIEAELALDLPAGPLPENRHGAAIASALARAPEQSPSGLTVETLSAEGGELEASFRTARPLSEPDLIVEGPRDLYFHNPRCEAVDLVTRCRMAIGGARDDIALEGKRLILTLSGRDYAAEIPAVVGKR